MASLEHNSRKEKKRERSTNFSEAEIYLLLDIVKTYITIIECKKTDGTTWLDKEKAWEQVTNELNSACTSKPRNKKSIQSKYADMKKILRKKLGHNNSECYRTGGGTADIIELTPIENILLSLMPKTGGSNSKVGSDAIEIITDEQCSAEENQELNPVINETITLEVLNEYQEYTELSSVIDESYEENDQTIREYITTPLTKKRKMVQSPITELNSETLVNNQANGEHFKNRLVKGVKLLNAPVSKELHTETKSKKSSKVLSKVEQESTVGVLNAKRQLLEIQCETAQYELDIKKKFDEIKLKTLQKELHLKEQEETIKELQIQKLRHTFDL